MTTTSQTLKHVKARDVAVGTELLFHSGSRTVTDVVVGEYVTKLRVEDRDQVLVYGSVDVLERVPTVDDYVAALLAKRGGDVNDALKWAVSYIADLGDTVDGTFAADDFLDEYVKETS